MIYDTCDISCIETNDSIYELVKEKDMTWEILQQFDYRVSELFQR